MPTKTTSTRTPRANVRKQAPTTWSLRVWKELDAYVAHSQSILRLADWAITVSRELCPDDAYAQITPVYAQKRATLQVGPRFLGLNALDQRQTIAHELIHCHLFATMNAVERVNGMVLTGLTAELAWSAFMTDLEVAVDGLADAMAPLLPKPWGL